MKRQFGFMNIADGHFQEVMDAVIASDYNLKVLQ
jgi:hypothetical protein